MHTVGEAVIALSAAQLKLLPSVYAEITGLACRGYYQRRLQKEVVAELVRWIVRAGRAHCAEEVFDSVHDVVAAVYADQAATTELRRAALQTARKRGLQEGCR